MGRAVLLQLDYPVGRVLSRAERPEGRGQARLGVAVDRHAESVLDRAEPGGHPLLAGNDGLAVTLAVRAVRQALAEALYLADMGFSLVGVGGDGEHGDAGAGGVQDQGDRLALGITAGQGDCPRAVALRPGLLGRAKSLPGPLAEPGEHRVGPVDLIAGPAEVLIDRP